MSKSKFQSENLDAVVDAIDELIEQKIRDALSTNPYWGGQVYEAQKVLRVKLEELLGE